MTDTANDVDQPVKPQRRRRVVTDLMAGMDVPTTSPSNSVPQPSGVASPEQDTAAAPATPRAEPGRSSEQQVESVPAPESIPAPAVAGGSRRKKTVTFYVSTGTARRWEKEFKKTRRTKYEVLASVIDSYENVDSMRKVIEESTVRTTVKTSLLPVDPKAVRLLGGAGEGDSRGIQVNMTPEQLSVLDSIGSQLGFETRSWVAPLLNNRLPGSKEKHPNSQM